MLLLPALCSSTGCRISCLAALTVLCITTEWKAESWTVGEIETSLYSLATGVCLPLCLCPPALWCQGWPANKGQDRSWWELFGQGTQPASSLQGWSCFNNLVNKLGSQKLFSMPNKVEVFLKLLHLSSPVFASWSCKAEITAGCGCMWGCLGCKWVFLDTSAECLKKKVYLQCKQLQKNPDRFVIKRWGTAVYREGIKEY